MISHRLLYTLMLSTAAFGADSAQWSSVRELKKGDRIGVIQTDMKRVEGRFESASDDGITVAGDVIVTVPKDKVARVYRRPRLNRVARVVVGGAIGAAGGAVVDGTFGQYLRNEGHGPDAGVITGLSAAGGAGIGAASGGGYATVYRR
jgi:hypothetical protein